ncbi:MAG: GNAT family N-acetyltransferase [Verrucomicrobia bacterium]|nr:GNAT family N-acetyltransferase [Verrucomicrobiota bacterium]
MALKIRAATTADRAEWGRLRRALWPDCQGARAELEMREQLGRPRRFGVLVIDRGEGKLGGFAELALRDGVDGAVRETTAFLEGWYVEDDLRGRGWGRKLITAAGRWARERGMVELASDAELENAAAIAAHRALGFRETFRVVQFLKRIGR